MLTIRDSYDRLLANITRIFTDYLTANPGLKSLVVGISGGIDSALTAALAHEVVASPGTVKVIGRLLPIETNTADEIARGLLVGQEYILVTAL